MTNITYKQLQKNLNTIKKNLNFCSQKTQTEKA